jgi:hypothetical protein
MVFDGPGAKLPIARLRVRRRVLVAEIARWLAARRAWMQPRAVPLLAALFGLLVTLGAIKYAAIHGQRQRLLLEHRAAAARHLSHDNCKHTGKRPPIRFVVEPLSPRDSRLEITLRPLELP